MNYVPSLFINGIVVVVGVGVLHSIVTMKRERDWAWP